MGVTDKVAYGISVVVTLIWAGSHVVGWIDREYKIPHTAQAAMVSVMTFFFAKPAICHVLKKKGGPNVPSCDD
jgi:hypothetical protein